MVRLSAEAAARLPTALTPVMDRFLASLGPRLERLLVEVRLYGPQVRRFAEDAPVPLLVVAEECGAATRASTQLARDDAGRLLSHPDAGLEVTLVSPAAWDADDASASVAVRQARREGLVLWRRPAAPTS